MAKRTSDQLTRLNKRFAAVTKAARDAVKPALDKQADRLVAAQKNLAPVDDGELKDSIRKTAGEHELQVVVTAGGTGATPGFYATFVEFGTSESQAQPFFYPAYRLNKKSMEAAIKRAIAKAIRDEWAGKS